MSTKPNLYTCASPALLNLYEVSSSIVIIIDILRATSTIATALHNGASSVIPVDSIPKCIEISKQIDGISAGERDGKIAEGLSYGNSPFEYPKEFINGKTLVLTTTNGTKLLQMALENNAPQIITGAFTHIDSVANYLVQQQQNVILGCAAWKDKPNLEDLLFAGGVIERIKDQFEMNCDTSIIASTLYKNANGNLFNFMQQNSASHYKRLMGFGAEQDLEYCLTENIFELVPLYDNGKLVATH
jgi:2-phosphosulfolactate phosphatase